MVAKYVLSTLGCKVNQYESQQLREMLESLGMQQAQPGEIPDLAVVNTCAVTVAASRKSRQTIRRLTHGGQTPVIVVGCGASADAERLRNLTGVTAVLGHDVNACAELRKLALSHLATLTAHGDSEAHAAHGDLGGHPDANRYDVSMIPSSVSEDQRRRAPTQENISPTIMAPALPVVKPVEVLAARIHRFAGHHRAILNVQVGCDASCTYCIIPRLRPNLRSKPLALAVAEARDLVRAGHKEIVVTGIYLGAYGRVTAIRKRFVPQASPLAALIKALANVEGLQRLRLSSLEPADVDEPLLEVLATHKCCVPHLHLPLQSGSVDVLRRMNRQYTRDSYIAIVDRVRTALDQPAITTDIIVGFPGETEADFQATLEIARYARFCKIHAFPFSPRERTAAARWSAKFVHPVEARERMCRLADVEAECSLAYRRGLLGRVERVIVERDDYEDHASGDGRGMRSGRADRYFEIHFESDEVSAGDMVPVRIYRITPARTHGTHAPPGAPSLSLPVLRSICA